MWDHSVELYISFLQFGSRPPTSFIYLSIKFTSSRYEPQIFLVLKNLVMLEQPS